LGQPARSNSLFACWELSLAIDRTTFETITHKFFQKCLTALRVPLYKYTEGCIFRMGATKTYRHGQILRLVSSERIANQEDLRRRLAQQRLRVTQSYPFARPAGAEAHQDHGRLQDRLGFAR